MYRIEDNTKILLAWLHNNIILTIDGKTVIGVILGNCIFSRNKKLIGKMIHEKFYLLNGRIFGAINPNLKFHEFDESKILKEAWDILSQIKEHSCQWIEETKKWDTAKFDEHFLR
jgi:hypothetical protein